MFLEIQMCITTNIKRNLQGRGINRDMGILPCVLSEPFLEGTP